MTDDHGPTVKALRHEKGRLKMVSRESNEPTTASAINDPPEEMLRDSAKLIAANAQIGVAEIETAKFVVKYIRAWDREQRAKIDAKLAAQSMCTVPLCEVCDEPHFVDFEVAGQEMKGVCRRSGETFPITRPNVDRTAPEAYREPSNPDDYTDPFNMVTRENGGGLTEFKRS